MNASTHSRLIRWPVRVSLLLLFGLLAWWGATIPLGRAQQNDTIRLGIYNSRALAMAWVRSDAFREERQREEAEAGEMLQRKLNFQGFGRYPVDQYIQHVQDQLPDLMEQRELLAIVWMCHSRRDTVVLVDVTEDLVRLFGIEEAQVQQIMESAQSFEPKDFATLYTMEPSQ